MAGASRTKDLSGIDPYDGGRERRRGRKCGRRTTKSLVDVDDVARADRGREGRDDAGGANEKRAGRAGGPARRAGARRAEMPVKRRWALGSQGKGRGPGTVTSPGWLG
jgi:hypothetical protein